MLTMSLRQTCGRVALILLLAGLWAGEKSARSADSPLTTAAAQKKKRKPRKPQRRFLQRVPAGVKVIRDLQYGTDDEKAQRLDLYLPQNVENPPLLVWIHGGGWRAGSKSRVPFALLRLTGQGYALASVEYRLNGLRAHPEHTHDCKGAIRWLRAHAKEYGYNAQRIGVAGGSAGGHLVLMLGMTAGVKELEGKVGGNLDQSSRVQAVVDLYGPSEFHEFARKNARFRRRYALTDKLFTAASPLTYLTKDDAPVLILHGDSDPIVPVEQAKLLHQRYQAAGLESQLHIIEGAGHGGLKFTDAERSRLIQNFFDRHIKQTKQTGGK